MEPMADASTIERAMLKKASDKKFPLNGGIELLPLCNLNCDMCYVRLSREEMESKGRMRTAEEWLALGQEMQKAGVMFLLLTGGEPLLHPEFKEIYLGLQKLGMIITLNTNGTLIDEAWADFFEANPPRRINITLYGVNNETYRKLCHYENGFDKTMRGIRLLKERGLDLRMGCSVTKYNKQDLKEFFAIRKELELYGIADTYMVAATRERERDFAYESRLSPEEAAECRMYVLREILGEESFRETMGRSLFEVEHILPSEEPEGVHCYAGNCSFAINWMGEMQPCVTMHTPRANVFEMGFEEAWSSVSENVSRIRVSEKCSVCKYRPICKYCAGNALVETGEYDDVPEYLCRYTKEFYRLMKLEYGDSNENRMAE